MLVGLAGVWAGRQWGVTWLSLADALAAILVAAIVLVVGGRLGKRAVDALLDRAPLDLMERLRAAVRSVPDIQGPVTLRARKVGVARARELSPIAPSKNVAHSWPLRRTLGLTKVLAVLAAGKVKNSGWGREELPR